ncbi:MAG TPA: hypothetical protein VE224_05490 [Pseudolabrys sp.]|nr:hypothetical protein [Pseudolabrys sp.]
MLSATGPEPEQLAEPRFGQTRNAGDVVADALDAPDHVEGGRGFYPVEAPASAFDAPAEILS